MKRMISIFMASFMLSGILSSSPYSGAAKEQMESQWLEMEHSAYDTLPPMESFNWRERLSLLDPHFLSQAFIHNGHRMIENRKKLIHTYGVTAQMEWVPIGKHPYTGFFITGSEHIIGRLSLAQPAQNGFMPGIALKFYRNDAASRNIMAMPSLDPQDNQRFFDNDFTTHLKRPKCTVANLAGQYAFSRALEQVSHRPTSPLHLWLEHLADTSEAGEQVLHPTAPYQLIFSPASEARHLDRMAVSFDDFREVLIGKGKNLILYDIYAISKEKESRRELIGLLKLKTNFLASEAGDRMFFQHFHP
jgi:hypothetical protein